ncbi:aromatic-ring-hydroxylating dioxygenase beta subunit [Catenulispora acidiphila DSM 44928]|uniref:Aromatic-ring-hydroxylating dioxygenase beta subunit n=2 Tax=Catenulispora acidiphila (strain DSM 44928 / JCM 14897 / NBRC 102108 / NRRL B-24433 / ID139908) TaxID=479433 RepID=C7PWR4_CATAD|nr:nuclear transport factor 2 family protein [Catenulispora acidiphila]ACU75344.1 aromatic-ring-hydroxylating dioxygenase beta subunit [Catenulispora acidiphila DSM 44928]6VW4_A Chain A, Aromatic-ring-hydroxylating dioxygenase beta subunit [Catenulispora acidiphila DSM 44928]6VW4_B Chain B, Aromatic-ring-hydroxylating dioxygenase beta subunit [Catenulispora acidiphila DSM 44928]
MADHWSQAALYAEVQQHQARQMHALDEGKFEEYADTFTPDGVFRHTPGRDPAIGREAIVRELNEFHERYAEDPVQRRHMFTMLAIDELDELDDSAVQADFYTLVLTTRVDGLTVGPSCPVRDVLVRGADGRLLTASRWVEHDNRTVAERTAAAR